MAIICENMILPKHIIQYLAAVVAPKKSSGAAYATFAVPVHRPMHIIRTGIKTKDVHLLYT